VAHQAVSHKPFRLVREVVACILNLLTFLHRELQCCVRGVWLECDLVMQSVI